ncbi:MAG: DUF2288 family protein [Thiohalomonadales bacterium]
MNTRELKKKLESESGYLNWQELEKHFARGVVRVITTNSSLIDIAIDIVQNNTKNISNTISNNNVSKPSDLQATEWQQLNTNFLCIVVAPFVLIQEFNSGIDIRKT